MCDCLSNFRSSKLVNIPEEPESKGRFFQLAKLNLVLIFCFQKRTSPDMSEEKSCEFLHQVVVSNIFYFHLYLGKIPILTHIFQLGWNHQLDITFAMNVSWTWGGNFPYWGWKASLQILAAGTMQMGQWMLVVQTLRLVVRKNKPSQKKVIGNSKKILSLRFFVFFWYLENA